MADAFPKPGIMIAVVGPSGAGKDSLLNLARERYRQDDGIGFVRRVITRPADGATEDHLPVTAEEFAEREQGGRFAVAWGAHGLRYGIPVETKSEIAAGRILLANGSRAALGRFRASYAEFAVLEITARPEIIAHRLAGRGRETADEISKRLTRDAGDWQASGRHIRIDNSGVLSEAADQLYEAIDSLRRSR